MDDSTAASESDVKQAFNSLTIADWIRLRKQARFRVRTFGQSAVRDDSDLLQETIVSVLAGSVNGQMGRHWNKKIPFIEFLLLAMKSITSHWREQLDKEKARFQSDLPSDDNQSYTERLASHRATAYKTVWASQEVERIIHLFQRDPEATCVLLGWSKGMNGPEIMREWQLSPQDFRAAVKRIRNHPSVLQAAPQKRWRKGKNGADGK